MSLAVSIQEGAVVIRKLGFVRYTVLVAICIIGICFAAQSFGNMGSVEADATANVASAAPLEWSVIGVVISGSLVLLIRPRRRKVVDSDK